MIYSQKQSGFSLVETLVAITLLLIIIVGPMSISSSAARSTSYSSEQVMAFFLAQEGAELAQKVRDDHLLERFHSESGSAWDNFVDDTDYSDCFSSGCGLELDGTDANGALREPIDCSGNACKMYINESGERTRYTYIATNASSTPYSRVITMTKTANREVEVVSKVSWQTGSQRRLQSVEAKTYLFNVYQN